MLRVLIVGCGNIAGGFDAGRAPHEPPLTHAGAWRRHGGFELAACVEPDEGRRADFMRRWGVSEGHARIEEVVASGARYDVVSVCSPTAMHHAHVVQSLLLGPRVVFCEKPISGGLEEAEDVVRRCREAGVLLAVNHNRRWDPDIVRLASELREGRWGRLRCVTAVYNKGLLNNGSHLFDLLHVLIGPLQLRHAGPPVHDFGDADPSVPVQLATADGACVMVNCGHAADYSLFELRLVLERASISMEDGGLRWRIRQAAASPQFSGYRALAAGETRTGHYVDAMSNAAANIYDAVLQGSALASTGDTALAAHRLCDQVRRHAAS